MEELKNLLYEKIPYYSMLGLELQEIGDGIAIFELAMREELTQSGTIHGGVLASLVDSSCACAAYSLIFPDGYITTIDLHVEFLRPVSSGRLRSIAKCIKSGKTIFFCKAKVWNEDNELICTGSSQVLRVK